MFQEGNLDARKVEMLINCLETGKDIWSDLEKRLLQTKGSWNGLIFNTSRHRQWSCWLPCPKAVNRQHIQAIYWPDETAIMARCFILCTNFFPLPYQLSGISISLSVQTRNTVQSFLSLIFSEWGFFFLNQEEKSIKFKKGFLTSEVSLLFFLANVLVTKRLHL